MLAGVVGLIISTIAFSNSGYFSLLLLSLSLIGLLAGRYFDSFVTREDLLVTVLNEEGAEVVIWTEFLVYFPGYCPFGVKG